MKREGFGFWDNYLFDIGCAPFTAMLNPKVFEKYEERRIRTPEDISQHDLNVSRLTTPASPH